MYVILQTLHCTNALQILSLHSISPSIMTSQPNGTNGDHAKATPEHYDAIVIGGGGFSGLRALYEVRRQGLNAKAFEAGSGIGGVCWSSLSCKLRH